MNVKPPLSLSHDGELNTGKTRVGMVGPSQSRSKKVKIFTRPNSTPGSYHLGVIAYMYDEDGAISERVEKKEDVECMLIDNMVR